MGYSKLDRISYPRVFSTRPVSPASGATAVATRRTRAELLSQMSNVQCACPSPMSNFQSPSRGNPTQTRIDDSNRRLESTTRIHAARSQDNLQPLQRADHCPARRSRQTPRDKRIDDHRVLHHRVLQPLREGQWAVVLVVFWGFAVDWDGAGRRVVELWCLCL